jgi:hypothetical protein
MSIRKRSGSSLSTGIHYSPTYNKVIQALHCPRFQTCPLSAQCTADSVESTDRDKGCRVCMGCSGALVTVRYPPALQQIQLQPLNRYFMQFFSSFLLTHNTKNKFNNTSCVCGHTTNTMKYSADLIYEEIVIWAYLCFSG